MYMAYTILFYTIIINDNHSILIFNKLFELKTRVQNPYISWYKSIL